MAKRVALIYVPGLTRADVQQGRLPQLARRLHPRRFAALNPSFPCLAPVVLASILTGKSPREHGVLGSHVIADATPPSNLWSGLSPSTAGLGAGYGLSGFDPVDDDELWDAARRREEALVVLSVDTLLDPSDPTARLEEFAKLDARFSSWRDQMDDDEACLVIGAPGRVRALAAVALPTELPGVTEPALSEGSTARISAPIDEHGALRDALLRLPGIERVLQGEGLASWRADHPQSSGTIVLAGPGITLDGDSAGGHPDDASAWVLGWGSDRNVAWPKEIHDYRIGRMIAHALGQAPGEEDPLPV